VAQAPVLQNKQKTENFSQISEVILYKRSPKIDALKKKQKTSKCVKGHSSPLTS
jgi:hypothetical protein